MFDQNPVNLRLMNRHAAKRTVNDDKPISIRPLVDPAKDMTPRKLSLAAKVRCDDAFVKSSPLGIFQCRCFIKRMGMTQEYALDSMFGTRGYHGRELPEARRMLAKIVLIPSWDA